MLFLDFMVLGTGDSKFLCSRFTHCIVDSEHFLSKEAFSQQRIGFNQ